MEENYEDYEVYATFFKGEDITDCEFIGSVELPENATFNQMPKELEVNGFTYKIEE